MFNGFCAHWQLPALVRRSQHQNVGRRLRLEEQPREALGIHPYLALGALFDAAVKLLGFGETHIRV